MAIESYDFNGETVMRRQQVLLTQGIKSSVLLVFKERGLN
jgi:hypothetical protein